jgi:hypothetical protein
MLAAAWSDRRHPLGMRPGAAAGWSRVRRLPDPARRRRSAPRPSIARTQVAVVDARPRLHAAVGVTDDVQA